MRSSTPPASVGPPFGPSDGSSTPRRPVQSISSVPASRRGDQDRRLRNYLISMGIRTLCFVLAGVFAIATDWTVAVWVCVAAAALLPYPAVVFANNVDRRESVMPRVSPMRAIGGSPASPAIVGTIQETSQDAVTDPDDPTPPPT